MTYIYVNVYLDSIKSSPVQRIVASKEDGEAVNYINSLTKDQILQTGISILDSVKEAFPKKYNNTKRFFFSACCGNLERFVK